MVWSDLLKIKRTIKNIFLDYKINRMVDAYDIDNMPVFDLIEIETQNRCNGECAFCPVNKHEPQREYARMSDELFKKIIEDLEHIDYSGKLCLSSNNEPFIDGRIVDFAIYARKHLAKAEIYLWTNGSLVTKEQIDNILPALNYMYIDAYSSDGTIPQSIMDIYDYLISKNQNIVKIYDYINFKNKYKVIIFKRDSREIKSSRGGQAPNKKSINKVIKRKCDLIFNSMVIRPTGEVSLCCCDALGKYNMGNVSIENVIDVWKKSATFKKVRREMQNNGRKSLDLCKNCDFGILL